MKTRIILLFIFIGTICANAQDGRGRDFDLEAFKKERREYFIKEIGLTDAEAKVFIPLTEELMKKKFELNRAARSEFRTLSKKSNISDADYTRIIDQNLDMRIKEAQLDKEYYQLFKKILSPEKLYKYQKTEMKFLRRVVKDTNQKSNKRH